MSRLLSMLIKKLFLSIITCISASLFENNFIFQLSNVIFLEWDNINGNDGSVKY